MKETHSLFAVQKLEVQNSTAELPDLPIMKKCWDYMHDIMEVNPDHSPVEIPLERMLLPGMMLAGQFLLQGRIRLSAVTYILFFKKINSILLFLNL